MDPVLPNLYAAHAYADAHRFVPLAPPPPPPPALPSVGPPAPGGGTVSPGGGTIGRFDLAALTTLPAAGPLAGPPAPGGGTVVPGAGTVGRFDAAAPPTVAPAGTPPPPPLQPTALPLPTPSALTTPLGPAGPPNIATLSRATALYTQTQQLVAPLAPPPTEIQQRQPSTLAPASAPTVPPTSTVADSRPAPTQERPVGVVGINSLGGPAATPAHLLGFARGTFLNVLA